MASKEQTTPMSYAQKLFLVKQIRDNPIIYKKPSNYNAIIGRKTAWETVTKNFNVNFFTCDPKSQQQLKRTWEYLRKKVKKDHSHYIRETHRTGGGSPPPPPKPADEVMLIVQLILTNDLPTPEDIFDSECVEAHMLDRLNSSAVECDVTPLGPPPAQKPVEENILLDNPGSPIIINSEDCELIDPGDLFSIGDSTPAASGAANVRQRNSCDPQDLPCTSSTPTTSTIAAAQKCRSFTGQKRKAADLKSAAHERCTKQQKLFREKLETKFDGLLQKAETTLDSLATAADKVGCAAERMASAAERIAAAFERVAMNFSLEK